ncbi:MAG: methyltransferase domain-containing protein [Deltaproteobacteria bacterium]|nr:methyltransferase domain-containing protein [Deltaproteobacteria bacterium]
MRAISCPICEKDDTRVVRRQHVQDLLITTVACLGCGLVYHNPVSEDQDRRERGTSHRQLHTGTSRNHRQHRKLKQRLELQWPLLRRVFRPGLRIMEVGCGLGGVGGRLQRQGARVWGVEPDPEQAAYARDHWGLAVLPKRFEELEWAGEPFDLFLVSHVIEHFPDPLAFLEKAGTMSHRGTRLFVETPNILAPKVSFKRLFSPAHNFYFSPQTLEWLLLKAGWQVERLKVWRRDSFQVLAKPCPPRPPEPIPQESRKVLAAISRHRYLYYSKLLFIWRKIPWWRKYWMYTPDPRYR